MVGQELPVFLLMTGLYDNIRLLQNEKNLTFLYRAPRVQLKTDEINPYRKRLIDKGIVNGEDYGHLRFTLPLFDEYALAQTV